MDTKTETQWVPVALGQDVPAGTVVPAMHPSGPIAVWRAASGHVSANADRCPHRGMRLSHGFVRGETLSCIYHGWRFGRDGACQHIPAHPDLSPPKTINCGPMPVRELNGVVWAAKVEPKQEPAEFDGFSALRSLVISAPIPTICEAIGGTLTAGGVPLELGGCQCHLLLSEYDPDAVLALALIDNDAGAQERVAASRAFEMLRRRAEAVQPGQVAS